MSSESSLTPPESDATNAEQGGVCVSGQGSCAKGLRWPLLAAGFAALVLGHVFLAFAGEKGLNFPGRLAPFLIIGGYVVFGCGLIPRHRT